jgi:hypothetical protein
MCIKHNVPPRSTCSERLIKPICFHAHRCSFHETRQGTIARIVNDVILCHHYRNVNGMEKAKMLVTLGPHCFPRILILGWRHANVSTGSATPLYDISPNKGQTRQHGSDNISGCTCGILVEHGLDNTATLDCALLSVSISEVAPNCSWHAPLQTMLHTCAAVSHGWHPYLHERQLGHILPFRGQRPIQAVKADIPAGRVGTWHELVQL